MLDGGFKIGLRQNLIIFRNYGLKQKTLYTRYLSLLFYRRYINIINIIIIIEVHKTNHYTIVKLYCNAQCYGPRLIDTKLTLVGSIELPAENEYVTPWGIVTFKNNILISITVAHWVNLTEANLGIY